MRRGPDPVNLGPSGVWTCMTWHQPFASAVVGVRVGSFYHPGPKRIENRPTRRRIPRGGLWIGVHAGLGTYPRQDATDAAFRMFPALGQVERLPRGAVVGIARVVDVVEYREAAVLDPPELQRVLADPWAFGPWCWVIDRAAALDEPLVCVGAQGAWKAPASLAPHLDALWCELVPHAV